MTAPFNAVTDAADPKQKASGGRVALTTLAVLVLIYQRHVPEPLLGLISIKPALDYVELSLAALLLGQLVRNSYRGACGSVRKIREFGRVASVFFKNSTAVRITLEVPEPDPAAIVTGSASGANGPTI